MTLCFKFIFTSFSTLYMKLDVCKKLDTQPNRKLETSTLAEQYRGMEGRGLPFYPLVV